MDVFLFDRNNHQLRWVKDPGYDGGLSRKTAADDHSGIAAVVLALISAFVYKLHFDKIVQTFVLYFYDFSYIINW